MEAQLGAQLFIRNSRNVKLTTAGSYLQRECYQLFTTLESVQITVKKIAEGLSGPLRIGYVGSAMQNILPGVIKKVNQHLPTLYIQLYELTTAEQVEALSSRRIDVGFLRPPLATEDLVIRKVYQEGFSLVLPLGHPIARHGLTNLHQVAEEPFVLFSKTKGQGLYHKIIRLCHAAGFSPRAMHEAN